NEVVVGTTETVGRTVSNVPAAVPTVFGLPGTSVAAPAGTVTLKAPSAVRVRVNVNVLPSPAARKSPTTTAPVVCSAAAVNPFTTSENATVIGIVFAFVVSDEGLEIVSVGGRSSK